MQSCSRSRCTHTSWRFKIKLSLITFRLFSLAHVQSANVETVWFGSGSNDYSRFKHLNFLHFTTADTSLIQWFHAFPRMIIFYEEAARSPLFVKHHSTCTQAKCSRSRWITSQFIGWQQGTSFHTKYPLASCLQLPARLSVLSKCFFCSALMSSNLQS